MPPHSRRVWRDNGLSIVLVVSFLATWLEQVLAGWDVYNDERRDEGRHAVSITEYLRQSFRRGDIRELGERVPANGRLRAVHRLPLSAWLV